MLWSCLWFPLFPCRCPPVAGPRILTTQCFDRSSTLQTARYYPTPGLPLQRAELCLRNPIKALDNNLPQFPPPHLHFHPLLLLLPISQQPLNASAAARASRFWSEKKNAARSLAPGSACFHNCCSKQSERLSSVHRPRRRHRGSLRTGC